MNQPAAPNDDLLPDDGLTEEVRHKVEEFIEEEEGSFNRYKGWLAAFLTAAEALVHREFVLTRLYESA